MNFQSLGRYRWQGCRHRWGPLSGHVTLSYECDKLIDFVRHSFRRRHGERMKKVVLSPCGYRCDLCPAYRKNLVSQKDREKVSEAWAGYFGRIVNPDEIQCDGCLESCEAPNPNCRVRPCVLEKKLASCAECDEFICEKLRKQMEAIVPVAEKHSRCMPIADFKEYFRPYISEFWKKDQS
jgi:hypothetical protein